MSNQYQQQKYNDSNYRCERCWATKNINLYPRSDFLGEEAVGFVILCDRCKDEASKVSYNKILFEKLFLRFASSKELIQKYDVKNESEALELWCNEHGIDISIFKINEQYFSQEEKSYNTKEIASPFGYKNEDEKLVIKKKEAKIVQEIFRNYLSGNTMEKIARDIGKSNAMASELNLSKVREILKDPVYAGYSPKGNEYVKGSHEPIVERETFNAVQKKIVRNIRNPKYLYEPLILGE